MPRVVDAAPASHATLKTRRAIPIHEGMIAVAAPSLSFTLATLGVLVAMVVAVYVSDLLEANTPARRHRGNGGSPPVRPERRAGSGEPAPVVGDDTRDAVDPGPPGRSAEAGEARAVPERTSTGTAVDHGLLDHDILGLAALRESRTDPAAPGIERLRPAASEEKGSPSADVAVADVVLADVAVADDEVADEEVADEEVATGADMAVATTVFVVRVDHPDGEVAVLGDPGCDRELAGVLFAAYVAAGLPERNRVTGWVAPQGSPPGLAGSSPDDRLRGRPGRVVSLLECAEGGRNWITLDARTDIGRGLTRRPPTDEPLKGLVWFWWMATDERACVPAGHVGVLRHGLQSVVDKVSTHPFRPRIEALLRVAEQAERTGADLRLESMNSASAALRGAGRGARGPAAVDRPPEGEHGHRRRPRG